MSLKTGQLRGNTQEYPCMSLETGQLRGKE